VHPTERPLKISLFGHFGSPNVGNESTLLATLARLRARFPDSEIRCICTIPETVIARDGIDAIPISTRTLKIWDRALPIGRRVPMAFAGLGAEAQQYLRAFAQLDGTDMLIVPGTGVLTDAYGLSYWGPYSLFKWVLAAKLRRVKVLLVSVGAGPIRTPAGKILVRAALSLADYRSFRDVPSRECVSAIGFRRAHDPVYPDLVFDLPEATSGGDLAPAAGRRPVVGLGLMVYHGKYSADDPSPETYSAYLEALAALAGWLIERGYDIALLLGDADTEAIADFRTVVSARLGDSDADRISARSIRSVSDLLAELAATDFVVATRFHNTLLALLLNKPVIAISFHHKCSSLMQQMGLSEYCHEIHRIDSDELIAQFQQLEHNRETVTRTIAAGVARARAALDEQYDVVFGGRGRAVPPTADRPRGRALSRRLRSAFLGRSERAWRHLPAGTRDSRPARAYGSWAHARVRGSADREMALGTLFLRNRPALELIRRLTADAGRDRPIRIAVLGCSIGVEVYSIIWTLRAARPDLELVVEAVDISSEVVEVGERGVYSAAASSLVNASIFAALTEAERAEMFDWDGGEATVKPWLRDGITWQVGDACDPDLIASLGPQDLVVANNFLCHMAPGPAERGLRTLSRLVRPGGHLVVTGVDLEVRTRVALGLGWEPVVELRAEIHDGDQLVRSDWPWRWWGLEPLDRRRADWEIRYSAVFRIGRPAPDASTGPDEALLVERATA
jgi:polysaccharide pyruvyl transferase WcaK-like protein/SAM-dependent methyltransferase